MSEAVREILLDGQVIPACPLALHADRTWSERHQRALARYYFASGAGGIAVGVHSTQFQIRDAKHGLFEPVLELVAEEFDRLTAPSPRAVVRIAGICGDTGQALGEVASALRFGYHAGLLSLTAVSGLPEERTLEHCRRVAEAIPVVGFYLQPAVGGRVFSFRFWRQFAEIENVVAVKIAPFNRYQTWDVVRAVMEAGRDDIALYTGNDDNIIGDLVTPFNYPVAGESKTRFIVGGLLGQWGVWTSGAVRMLENIAEQRGGEALDTSWLEHNVRLTDANAVIFDAAHQFAGCIPGIMEVLRRQGLAPSNACLDPDEVLSPGQAEELNRIARVYPNLHDDRFVEEHLDAWLAD